MTENPVDNQSSPDQTTHQKSQSPRPKPKIGDSIRPPETKNQANKPAPKKSSGSQNTSSSNEGNQGNPKKKRRRRGGRGRGKGGTKPVEARTTDTEIELSEEILQKRRGKQRKGKAVGRYSMFVSVRDDATHIAVCEGRELIEHYVSRPSDDELQIHGNIYLGRVQNVLPGMEAAFIEIGTPKNAVLYRSDVVDDSDSGSGSSKKGSKKSSRNKRRGSHRNRQQNSGGDEPRIEQMLTAGQTVLCQVTKNPIAHKGARLTMEVSLPGRFVVMIPNQSTTGISKRLPDAERKRLRKIVDKCQPKGHGLIVRTAAEHITREEIEADIARLVDQWEQIQKLVKKSNSPSLLYREPDMAVRIIREEFTKEYRTVTIDGKALFEEVQEYVRVISPALGDRVNFYDHEAEKLSLFERHHVYDQLRKALDRKVWLPSGGSLIIERTEALTVIDVNTGKNVGSSSLEETVFKNNLEAAIEVARQLRLRDIGGIVVIDFIDMEIVANRGEVVKVFREALARDKTRTQVFAISELGLVEMTRKRIGEGLLESYSSICQDCEGSGYRLDVAALKAL